MDLRSHPVDTEYAFSQEVSATFANASGFKKARYTLSGGWPKRSEDDRVGHDKFSGFVEDFDQALRCVGDTVSSPASHN